MRVARDAREIKDNVSININNIDNNNKTADIQIYFFLLIIKFYKFLLNFILVYLICEFFKYFFLALVPIIFFKLIGCSPVPGLFNPSIFSRIFSPF